VPLAQVFCQSINPRISQIAQAFVANQIGSNPLSHCSLDASIISVSDVLNENVNDVFENPQKSLQLIEQFQPFLVNDVADFISNLVSETSPISKSMLNDRANIVSLLRPFKSAHFSYEELVRGSDKETISVHSHSSFQLFLTCLKEISGTRNFAVGPFLGKWQFPLAQVAFLTHIVSWNSFPVVFPRPRQFPRTSPVLIGDFRDDHWRCMEFIETLVFI